MDNIKNIMQNQNPNLAGPEGTPMSEAEASRFAPVADQLKQATGLTIDRETIAGFGTEPVADDRPRKAVPIDGIRPDDLPNPVSTPQQPEDPPAYIPPGMQVMDAETAKSLGIEGDGEVINYAEEAAKKEQEKFLAAKREQQEEMAKMFNDALKEEEDRNTRLENTLNADAEVRERILGPQNGQATVSTATVVTYDDRKKEDRDNGGVTFDPSEYMPSYSMDDDEEKKDESTEDGEFDVDAYAERIRSLDPTEVVPYERTAVTRIKAPAVSTVPRNSHKNQPVGDQAFLNAVSRFKKDTFGKVTVPLINSGFMCDIVGTGVVDLQNMYVNISRDTTVYDYQLEQMRVVMRNVVGTSPKIRPETLSSMIHYQDFQMMSFGLVCATLDTVESVGNCPECGKDFRISANPTELLLNMNEICERVDQIRSAPNVEAYSLMTEYKEITAANGIVVTLGHPSYQNEITIIKSFLEYSKNMTAADAYRFRSMLRMLYMVRKIKLPSGVVSNNLYQHYMALQLLRAEELDAVSKEVSNMRKQMIIPKFGIHKIICPHCGHEIVDYPYDNLMELVFLDTTVKGYLNGPEA